MGAASVPIPAYHSSVHSHTLPIMSWAPQPLVQAVPAPVLRRPPAFVTHAPLLPSEAPGSTVPRAASSHSAPLGSRLPPARHAVFAWNQVMLTVGCTPVRLSA